MACRYSFNRCSCVVIEINNVVIFCCGCREGKPDKLCAFWGFLVKLNVDVILAVCCYLCFGQDCDDLIALAGDEGLLACGEVSGGSRCAEGDGGLSVGVCLGFGCSLGHCLRCGLCLCLRCCAVTGELARKCCSCFHRVHFVVKFDSIRQLVGFVRGLDGDFARFLQVF